MLISSNTLFRLGGAAALIGGLTRCVSSFIPYQENTALLEVLYAFIDICLLFGLIAIYLKHAERLGGLGLIAFGFAASGTASIVGPDAIMFGINFYIVGAAILIIGLLLLSIQMIRKKVLIWAASCWLLSSLCTFLTMAFANSPLFVAAGISFGAAYVLSGINLLRGE